MALVDSSRSQLSDSNGCSFDVTPTDNRFRIATIPATAWFAIGGMFGGNDECFTVIVLKRDLRYLYSAKTAVSANGMVSFRFAECRRDEQDPEIWDRFEES